MSLPELLALLAAGVASGLAGSMAGLASVASYPALLALGLDPVTANVTNSVGLVALTVASVTSSRPELTGHRTLLTAWAPLAAAGGLIGAGLLLVSSPRLFELIAPVLIVGAALVVLARPLLLTTAESAARPLHGGWRTRCGVLLVCVYAGYFGAAAGVLLVALILMTVESMAARAMALRAALLGIANGVASIWFVVSGHVHWPFLPMLMVGMALGGWLGPKLNRRLPDDLLRTAIALVGVIVGLWLGIDAYF